LAACVVRLQAPFPLRTGLWWDTSCVQHVVSHSSLPQLFLLPALQQPAAAQDSTSVQQAVTQAADAVQAAQAIAAAATGAGVAAQGSDAGAQATEGAVGTTAAGAAETFGTAAGAAGGGIGAGAPGQAAAAAATANPDQLFLCPDKPANATIVEQLPQLKIEQVLLSNKPHSPQDVTLVTQLSFER
jgi:hypothetical protein